MSRTLGAQTMYDIAMFRLQIAGGASRHLGHMNDFMYAGADVHACAHAKRYACLCICACVPMPMLRVHRGTLGVHNKASHVAGSRDMRLHDPCPDGHVKGTKPIANKQQTTKTAHSRRGWLVLGEGAAIRRGQHPFYHAGEAGPRGTSWFTL